MTDSEQQQRNGLQLSTAYPFYANEHIRYRLVTELNDSFRGKVLMGVPKGDDDVACFIRVGKVVTPICFETYQGSTYSLNSMNFYEKIPSLPSSGVVYIHSLNTCEEDFRPGIYVINKGNAVEVPDSSGGRIVLTTNEIETWSPVDIKVSKDAYEV